MRKKAVIIGAGGLGLGFLAERMAQDYDLCLADTSAKADTLSRIRDHGGFTLNVCGLDRVCVREVTGTFTVAPVDTSEGRDRLYHALQKADLVFTATGRAVLGRVVADICPSMNARSKKGWLLFCENGLNIAATYAPHFGPQTLVADTVMSRMCRYAGPQEEGYQPLWPGHSDSLVVEDYDFLPLDAERCSSGPFTSVFSMVTHAQFLCWEDIKLFMHNGVHAFVSYSAFLEGVKVFPDTPSSIREAARDVVLKEVVPAIVSTHPTVDPAQIEQYGLKLLERFFNPFFNDSIERGVRGIQEKLAPGERLLGGCEYIRRAGIEPRGYAQTVQAAKEIVSGSQGGRDIHGHYEDPG